MLPCIRFGLRFLEDDRGSPLFPQGVMNPSELRNRVLPPPVPALLAHSGNLASEKLLTPDRQSIDKIAQPFPELPRGQVSTVVEIAVRIAQLRSDTLPPAGGIMPSFVTVEVAFEAAHRLHNPARDEEWNRECYGKCNNPYGHGHNYILEVTVSGEIDPETGYLIDMSQLKAIIHQRVVSEVDHRFLNIEIPWLEGVIPSAENLAREFYKRLRPALDPRLSLECVTVHETPRNRASFRPSGVSEEF